MTEHPDRTGDDISILSGAALLPLFKTLPSSLSALSLPPSYPSLSAHPLLSIAVLQVIEERIVPAQADVQQIKRLKAILSHDHEISEESS